MVQDDLLAFLIELREEAGLSQADLGKCLGLSQGHVSRIEDGEHPITLLDIYDWLWVCDLPLRRLEEFVRIADNKIYRARR